MDVLNISWKEVSKSEIDKLIEKLNKASYDYDNDDEYTVDNIYRVMVLHIKLSELISNDTFIRCINSGRITSRPTINSVLNVSFNGFKSEYYLACRALNGYRGEYSKAIKKLRKEGWI